jgi:hypothetical protein
MGIEFLGYDMLQAARRSWRSTWSSWHCRSCDMGIIVDKQLLSSTEDDMSIIVDKQLLSSTEDDMSMCVFT